jgi:hypothetical protein
LDASWAAPSGAGAAALEGAEDDDAESDDGAGDAGDEDDAGAAELVGGGSADGLWRSPHAPSSKAAVMAIDSVERFIVLPFNEFMEFMDERSMRRSSRLLRDQRSAAMFGAPSARHGRSCRTLPTAPNRLQFGVAAYARPLRSPVDAAPARD